MKICDYGCGREAHFPFKNGKWCCSKSCNSCPFVQNKVSKSMKGKNTGPQSEEHKKNISKAKKDKPFSEKHKKNISKAKKDKPFSEEHKKNISKAMKEKNTGPQSEEHKKKRSELLKFTLKDYKEKYPLFFKIEELRETKDGEIQGHCKNYKCKNSKEKGGWFTLTRGQLGQRIDSIEKPRGFGESHFYCSQYCKDTCILHGLRGDPYRDTGKPYTSAEKEVFNKLILKRDNEICYYCKEHTATIVHHLRPQKLEPFFALDPDYAVSVCKKCHYEKGHPTGSEHSTGNLSKIVCSVESQKFLNQNKKGK